MFRKRPSKGYMKQEFAATQSSRKPSRVIHLPYFEIPEADDAASIDEQASIVSQSVYEDQTLEQEPLFREPFIWELPRHESKLEDDDKYEEEEAFGADYSENSEAEEISTDDDDDIQGYDDEDFVPQIRQATTAVLPPKSIFNSSWNFSVGQAEDDEMFEHYLSSEDNISIYSIHEPAIAIAVPLFNFSKPKLVDIPPMAGRKRRPQYDSSARQNSNSNVHSRNQSKSSDNSSRYSSQYSSSGHSDNESNGEWDSPASSLATTPTVTSPASPSGAFPKHSRKMTYPRPKSGVFPQLDKLTGTFSEFDKLAEKYVPDAAPSNKPFRRSVARGGLSSSRPTSLLIPAYGDDDDIDELMERTERAVKRREWQSSASVWHR